MVRVIIDRIHKTYLLGQTAVPALRGISLKIESGEFYCVMGPSGCGKTTLLNLVGGIDFPSKGRVFLGDLDLGKASDDQLADIRLEKVGFIFQFFNLLSNFTALENVELPMTFARFSKKDRKNKALELLEQVGLSERADHIPNELSGGEQQRVAIARALANSPEILLADEPTGDLDSKSGAEVLQIIKNLNQEKGVTVCMATHNPEVAAYAEKVVQLLDGKIVSEKMNRV